VTAVIGAGSFGTTLAKILAEKGDRVTLWARDQAIVDGIRKEHRNPKYVTDVTLPSTIVATTDLKEALRGQEVVLHVVPSKATRETARSYAKHLDRDAVIVSATKGLEYRTHKRMSQVIGEETGHTVGALSGPNHAEEIGALQPTAAVVSHPHMEVAENLAKRLNTQRFKVYPRRDLIGTEICGAYKNVVALAGGMVDGLGWGDNAVACLITLGVDEMIALCQLFGGDERTVYGLAGLGDLVATATSPHSRNRFYGAELAKGLTREEIEKKMHGMVAEGVHAARAFHGFAEAEEMNLRLTRVIHGIVHEGRTVGEGVHELLSLV
jgi:glycerol-3-phosphate dehydrogenase (NAD(P)+)